MPAKEFHTSIHDNYSSTTRSRPARNCLRLTAMKIASDLSYFRELLNFVFSPTPNCNRPAGNCLRLTAMKIASGLRYFLELLNFVFSSTSTIIIMHVFTSSSTFCYLFSRNRLAKTKSICSSVSRGSGLSCLTCSDTFS